MESIKADVDRLTKEADQLREQWRTTKAQQFVEQVDENCPYCGQQLPMEKVSEDVAVAREKWSAAHEADLAKINSEGKLAMKRVEQLNEQAAKEMENLAKSNEQLAADSEKAEQLESLLESFEGEDTTPDFMANIKYSSLCARITEREKQLSKQEGGEDELNGMLAQKREKMDALGACDNIIAMESQYRTCLNRIDELTEQQRQYGIEVADIERFQILIEQFITDRCKALEESINAMFPTVRWKLFDIQINTGVNDTCICIIPDKEKTKTAEYPSANNAAQINAGLEIINVLCDFYGVRVPVFVDNAEAVNELIPIDSQLIALYVSRDDEIRIENNVMTEVQ